MDLTVEVSSVRSDPMSERLTGGDVQPPSGEADSNVPEVVIVVRGGVVQDVYASKEPRQLIWLVDWDNIMDGSGRETHAELIDPGDISELDPEARLRSKLSWCSGSDTDSRKEGHPLPLRHGLQPPPTNHRSVRRHFPLPPTPPHPLPSPHHARTETSNLEPETSDRSRAPSLVSHTINRNPLAPNTRERRGKNAKRRHTIETPDYNPRQSIKRCADS